MNETATKATIAIVLASLSLWLELLVVPLALLIASMILDYITGLMAASHRGSSITSLRSIHGITKKVCHLLLVAVGLLLDYLVLYVKGAFDLGFPWSFVISAVVAVWLVANEVISILENIQDITGALPPWLLPIAKNIRGKVESISATSEKEDD